MLTKFGLRWDTTEGHLQFATEDENGKPIKVYRLARKESLIKECEDSLQRLGTDYIDLYQIHWPDLTTPIEETFEAVAQLLKEGKIRAAGVSNYSVEQMETARKVVPIASNQMPYSMVLRDIEKEVVPYCQAHQMGILAYSPLQRGLLTGKIKPGQEFAAGDHRAGLSQYKPENVRRTNAFLEKIKPLAQEKKATLSQLVIGWTIRQPGITCALVGARNPTQAEENAAAANLKLSAEEITFINNQLAELELVK